MVDRIVVRFLVPIREDPVTGNGQLHPPFRWKSLQDALQASFGGWSARVGEVDGVWIDPQTRKAVQDTSRVFEVDVDQDRLPEIRSLLGRTCLSFVQQCIRVEILGRVEYIEGDPDDQPL